VLEAYEKGGATGGYLLPNSISNVTEYLDSETSSQGCTHLSSPKIRNGGAKGLVRTISVGESWCERRHRRNRADQRGNW